MSELKLRNHNVLYIEGEDCYGYVKTIRKDNKPVEVHSLLRLHRYDVQTREGALRHLQRANEQVENQNFQENLLGENNLEYFISQLSPEVKEEVKDGKGKNVDFILDSCGFPSKQVPHLMVEHCYIPLDVMKEPYTTSEEYETLLQNQELLQQGFSTQFLIDLTLTSGGALPAKEIVDYYVRRGVWGAPELWINTPSYDKEQVLGVIDELYSALRFPQKIQTIQDVTQDVIVNTLFNALSASLPQVLILSSTDFEEDPTPEGSSEGHTVH